jgi:hypothetical protein
MKRMRWALGTLALAAAAVVLVVGALALGRGRDMRQARLAAPGTDPARISPDYRDTAIPPNISPLNFKVAESGVRFYARARGSQGTVIEILSRSPVVAFPEKSWRRLLESNKGGPLYIDIGIKMPDNAWRRFAPITNRIAGEEIDSHLVYRKIHPAHNTWSSMGIYQRDLRGFQETPVLQNKNFGNDCCHCHSLCDNNPANASLDIRSSKFGNSLLIVSNGAAFKVSGTVGFSAWHPSGRMLASSFNKPRLMLHSTKNDMRDIVDLEGWLGYFFLSNTQVKRIPGLSDENRLFTFPCWSPDGRLLYYCSSPNPLNTPGKTRNANYAEIKFDLMRMPYDIDRDQWGEAETVLAASDTGLSIVQPRLSPDGRWLTCGMCDYGCWPTYHPESDLYVVDLKAGRPSGKFAFRKMEINSTECESWHGWSSNSRWIVFSSKRGNPLFSRPYLAYVDDNGHFQKPFLVPQRDPDFYNSYLKTYTIPTLSKGPFVVNERQLTDAIKTSSHPPLSMPPPRIKAAAEEANRLDPNGADAGKQQ